LNFRHENQHLKNGNVVKQTGKTYRLTSTNRFSHANGVMGKYKNNNTLIISMLVEVKCWSIAESIKRRGFFCQK